MPQIAGSLSQGGDRSLRLLCLIDSYVDLGMGQVTGNFNIREADKTNLRILDFLLDQLCQFPSDFRGNTLRAIKLSWHVSSTYRGASECPGDFNALETLNLVPGLDIVVLLYANATFRAGLNLVCLILETTQGFKRAFKYDHVAT